MRLGLSLSRLTYFAVMLHFVIATSRNNLCSHQLLIV